MATQQDSWYDEAEQDDETDVGMREYEITASPNDFNVSTLYNFIEVGSVSIPGFQRNYVWDIRRASKLIESLIIGLPIPQLFFYQTGKNKFLVVDGQQRLMSIFYFMKGRFPRKEGISIIRRKFDEEEGVLPAEFLNDDRYFSRFSLSLPAQTDKKNPLNGLTYDTLGVHRSQLDIRPIRSVIIRQNFPEDDDSSVYEIFNRLNSGGVPLEAQEIRVSLYHSKFYDMLLKANLQDNWRRLLGTDVPDLHLKDIEVLLRGFAILCNGEEYQPSMTKFLNKFSKRARGFSEERVSYLHDLLNSFLTAVKGLPLEDFFTKGSRRFAITVYEAVFAAVCEPAFKSGRLVESAVAPQQLKELRSDPGFIQAAQYKTTSKENVQARVRIAREKLGAASNA